MKTKALVFVSMLLIALALSARSLAQTTASGELTGTVTDPSGAVVPGAAVELKTSQRGWRKGRNRGATQSKGALAALLLKTKRENSAAHMSIGE
jgi:hypothetical protein